MGFWIFMLIMDLLLPFTMIGFGRYFMKKAPKEINSVFGYRTSMSMKNKDTWEFAHKYCGKVWYVCGMVMLPITVIFMLLVIGKNEDCVGSIGGIICGVQLIPLIGSILPTEIALKKNFDKNGNKTINSSFPNHETAPGVTCWSRRGRSCYLFLLCHFSRARCAAQ